MKIENCSYVDADGSYGTGEIILFDDKDLTLEEWNTLYETSDNERIEYVYNILVKKQNG